MKGLAVKLGTAWALGPINLLRVLYYRLGIRFGWNPVLRLQASPPVGPFFDVSAPRGRLCPPAPAWDGALYYFGWKKVPVAGVPDWFAQPFSGKRFERAERDWWQIADFDPSVGDIKVIWEPSRFDWVLLFAQQARAGDSFALSRLNDWLNDWNLHNPPYKGPNWKCGQEASIRLMHLAMATVLLDSTKTALPGLVSMIVAHLQRIEPTMVYAVAQDNNHGTSEAAALFIGGSWLEVLGDARGVAWAHAGRRWLENRVQRLIDIDGSFSQYSTNYHRMMLDTLSMVEIWRRELALPKFSKSFTQRVVAAITWLRDMVGPETGRVPNLGANDGARLLSLSTSDYTDFRPTVQTASVLYCSTRSFPADGSWNQPLGWFGIDLPSQVAPVSGSRCCENGGYVILRQPSAKVVLRFPRFRFRPSHADALHLDLWCNGKNVLRDGGTFSYSESDRWLRYFSGTESHNTVQFDGRDQMPRLGRFLFGAWLKTSRVRCDLVKAHRASAGYRDWLGACHERTIDLQVQQLIVTDRLSGRWRKAVLRWRLPPGEWSHSGQGVSNGTFSMQISASMPLVRMTLETGWESLYYLQRTDVTVLEIEVHSPGLITTECSWN